MPYVRTFVRSLYYNVVTEITSYCDEKKNQETTGGTKEHAKIATSSTASSAVREGSIPNVGHELLDFRLSIGCDRQQRKPDWATIIPVQIERIF
jgi:hypothetical protein